MAGSKSTRLRDFVRKFAPELGRIERHAACIAYLQYLLSRRQRRRRSAASGHARPHALRQFVNRSPWDHEAVLRKLRLMTSEHVRLKSGSLMLTEIKLPKQGLHPAGCDYQHYGFRKKRPQEMHYAKCQCLVVWCWVDDTGVWPLAARLYLPMIWSFTSYRASHSSIPPEHKSYRTKTQVAMDLLDEIRTDWPNKCHILVDEAYAHDWSLFSELDRRRENYLIRLNFDSLWPIDSEMTQQELHRLPRDFLLKIIHYFQNYPWIWRAIKAAKKSRRLHAMFKIPARVRHQRGHLLGVDRYLFWRIMEPGFGDFHLINHPRPPIDHLVELTDRLATAMNLEEVLIEHYGLRKFEGRSWQGFHHHVTLCFMACYFANAPK